MESGTIVKWLKAEGDRVEKGEPLYELDTDKVTQEVEAEVSGVLLKIQVETGEVDVGTTIAVIGEEGESAADGDGASANGKGKAAAEEAEEEPKEEEPKEEKQAAPAPVAAAEPDGPADAPAR